MNALDTPQRPLRQVYDATYAEMRALSDEIMALHRRIDRLTARHTALEVRACTLGDELARRAK